MFRRIVRTLTKDQGTDVEEKTEVRSNTNKFDHFTEAVETVKQLKRERRHDEAEELLLWCIEEAEKDDDFSDPPPWYYKHLAIVYRKDGQHEDEVKIIERYLSEADSPREELLKRLQRAKELAEKAE